MLSRKERNEAKYAALGRAVDRAIFVDFGTKDGAAIIIRNSDGLERLAKINRRKRSDPVTKAKRAGRDVLDLRSYRGWL